MINQAYYFDYRGPLIFSEKLIRLIRKEEGRVFIQTHNFPDPDAISAAFGLKDLLAQKDIHTEILYDGELQRDSLIRMISELKIPVYHWRHFHLIPGDRIIIVDGCKGNSNVEDLVGREIAVVDHHESSSAEDVELADIRPAYGSCSSIISEYFREQELTPSGEAASALLIGLARDTDLYTRGLTPMDLEAQRYLFAYADHGLVTDILRNNIQLSDLRFFHAVIDQVRYEKGTAFCYLPEGCPQNLLGILGDFLLSLNEVRFVCLLAKNPSGINLSFRNEAPELNAASIMKRFLEGKGRGGGHKEMAGGQIGGEVPPDPAGWHRQLLTLILSP